MKNLLFSLSVGETIPRSYEKKKQSLTRWGKEQGVKVTLLRNVIAINNMTIVLEVKNSYQTHDKVSPISKPFSHDISDISSTKPNLKRVVGINY